MHLSLIGMSNVGKTTWARRLEQHGFTRISIDDLIEEKLEGILQDRGFSGIADVARWMGQPYAPEYAETSRTYLRLETESMQETLDRLASDELAEHNVVVDTTGSVIHTGDAILERLQQQTIVVHLQTSQRVMDVMFQKYMAEPKPLIWGDSFSQQENESSVQALERCYPQMLARRSEKYQQIEMVPIAYDTQRQTSFTVRNLLDTVEQFHQTRS